MPPAVRQCRLPLGGAETTSARRCRDSSLLLGTFPYAIWTFFSRAATIEERQKWSPQTCCSKITRQLVVSPHVCRSDVSEGGRPRTSRNYVRRLIIGSHISALCRDPLRCDRCSRALAPATEQLRATRADIGPAVHTRRIFVSRRR
jgi:hypothetical protein